MSLSPACRVSGDVTDDLVIRLTLLMTVLGLRLTPDAIVIRQWFRLGDKRGIFGISQKPEHWREFTVTVKTVPQLCVEAWRNRERRQPTPGRNAP
jgi:hypothetical protein